MSKKKPESLTERQHFLLYEYKFKWHYLSRQPVYPLIKKHLTNLDHLKIVFVPLLGLVASLLASYYVSESILSFVFIIGLNFFCFTYVGLMNRYFNKILRKRLQEEWKDVPVIGEDGEPISKAEEHIHA